MLEGHLNPQWEKDEEPNYESLIEEKKAQLWEEYKDGERNLQSIRGALARFKRSLK